MLVFFKNYIYGFWFFGCKACGILAPWPGIEPELTRDVSPHWKVNY